MKVNSIWQPYASLAAHGYKTIETKVWPAPQSIIGQRLGIASTKNMKPEQRATMADEEFLEFYSRRGLPLDIEELPFGYLLGSVTIDSCHLVTPELLEDISAEEQMYGWYEVPGRQVYAWFLTDARPLAHPIPIRGSQGIYDWNGVLPDAAEDQAKATAPDQARPADIRSSLRLV